MAVARFVRSVVTTDSLIDTVPFVPALLLSEKEIVPSEVGAGNFEQPQTHASEEVFGEITGQRCGRGELRDEQDPDRDLARGRHTHAEPFQAGVPVRR